MLVPLRDAPGHAQIDFGEAVGIIGGVECKLHFLYMDLPHSDGYFVKANRAETTEPYCDGHVSDFAFFGGIPLSILYDYVPGRAIVTMCPERLCGLPPGKTFQRIKMTEHLLVAAIEAHPLAHHF